MRIAPPPSRHSRYTNKILEQYRRDGKAKIFDPDYASPLPPHVYAIADNAYRLMNNPTSENQKRNQSILVRPRERVIGCLCENLRIVPLFLQLFCS